MKRLQKFWRRFRLVSEDATMGFLLGLNAILWIAGFLLPVPCFILALRGWFKTRNTFPVKPWRRKISQVALGLFTLGLALWLYALSRIGAAATSIITA